MCGSGWSSNYILRRLYCVSTSSADFSLIKYWSGEQSSFQGHIPEKHKTSFPRNGVPASTRGDHECKLSCSVMSNSLWPHGLQHVRLPCLSATPRACLNSCPSSQWCHPTISSSVSPFSSCLQSFPTSRAFLMSWFFTSGGQNIGVSASASVLPGLTSFRMDWLDLSSVQGTLQSLL